MHTLEGQDTCTVTKSGRQQVNVYPFCFHQASFAEILLITLPLGSYELHSMIIQVFQSPFVKLIRAHFLDLHCEPAFVENKQKSSYTSYLLSVFCSFLFELFACYSHYGALIYNELIMKTNLVFLFILLFFPT